MARNKECLIILFDVRQNTDEQFKQKSIKCAGEILKDKICAARKDYVSFVLLGTKRTFNDVNSNQSHDGYLNIVQYPQVQLATWQLLINLYKFVNEEADDMVEWLDGLVVALDMITSAEETFKFERKRILLFYDFNGKAECFDMFDCITKSMVKLNVQLVVVSSQIQYIDNPANGEPQAIFRDEQRKTDLQLENEKYALRLVTHCNAKLCNFEEGLNTIFRNEQKVPWTWNGSLSIGTKIKINISGLIAIKDESNIKLKKCRCAPEEMVTHELKSFVRGNEVLPLEEDLIDAYMLGATPIPYDESLAEKQEPYETGLKFLGFTKSSKIPPEYHHGDSLYWVVHRKGLTASARKMDALVKALISSKMAMLCWKIYSVKFNNPKLVVLIPNAMHADRPASLAMIELTYHAQHHFWDFPSLTTQKTECTSEQMAAIDNLIDAMDLTLQPKDAQQPRDTYQKDYLPFDTLPHIYEQNVMDILERKVICNAGEDDEQFQEMLADKNFVEKYWRVPEEIEQKAKNAANAVKKLFPLEKSTVSLDKAKTRLTNTGYVKPSQQQQPTNDAKPPAVPQSFDSVGQKTPAEDFEQLLQQHVITQQDSTLRNVRFLQYADQMRSSIWSLIFKASASLEGEKIANALKLYRKYCYDFNAIHDYNKWMHKMKAAVEDRKLYDFWHSIIVKDDLGLCIVGEPMPEEKLELEEFYKVKIVLDPTGSWPDSDDEMDDDDLMASLSKKSECT